MTTTMGSVRNAANSDNVDKLARIGLATRGVLYLLIGWLAVLVAQGDRSKEADQRGALHEVARQSFGTVLLIVVAIGLVGYALWRFKEAAFGVSGKGREKLPRFQSLVRGVLYAFFAYNCIALLVGRTSGSQAQQTQVLTGNLMQHTAGRWIVGAAGVIVVAVALFLVYEAVTRKFRERLKRWEMSQRVYQAVVVLGVVGTAARGVVFAVAGVLVVQAAVSYDAGKARGIDGALRSLAESSPGPGLLVAAAIGLMVFGLFGCAEAIWERT